MRHIRDRLTFPPIFPPSSAFDTPLHRQVSQCLLLPSLLNNNFVCERRLKVSSTSSTRSYDRRSGCYISPATVLSSQHRRCRDQSLRSQSTFKKATKHVWDIRGLFVPWVSYQYIHHPDSWSEFILKPICPRHRNGQWASGDSVHPCRRVRTSSILSCCAPLIWPFLVKIWTRKCLSVSPSGACHRFAE
jgi:hypothetical protein